MAQRPARQPHVILIAETRPTVAAGFKVFLSRMEGTAPVAITAGFDHVLEHARREEPALIIVGQGLDWDTPLGEFLRLHQRHPGWRMVLLAEVADRDTIMAGVSAGAVGIISTAIEEDELHWAIARILAGGTYIQRSMAALGHHYPVAVSHRPAAPAHSPLTPRQLEVLGVLAQGKSNKQIAEILAISLSTVSMHLNAAFHALGVHDRSSAAMAYRDLAGAEADDRMGWASGAARSHATDHGYC